MDSAFAASCTARMRALTMDPLAVVPINGLRSRNMSEPSCCAKKLSPCPNECTAAVDIATVGRCTATCASNMGSISRGGPGKHQMRDAPMLANKPGAVPRIFFKQRAPLGRNACTLLLTVIGRPRSRNQRSRSASACGSTSSGSLTSIARRSASRVRSSSVGPSPPVITIMS